MKSTLLRHVQVVDGTGAPARQTDVLIRGDRIASMAPALSTSAE